MVEATQCRHCGRQEGKHEYDNKDVRHSQVDVSRDDGIDIAACGINGNLSCLLVEIHIGESTDGECNTGHHQEPRRTHGNSPV